MGKILNLPVLGAVALFVMLSQVAAGPLPDRLVVMSKFYLPEGVNWTDAAGIDNDFFMGLPDDEPLPEAQVPPEIAAYGFKLGDPHLMTFGGYKLFSEWPYFVLQNGVPMSAVKERDDGLSFDPLPKLTELGQLPKTGPLAVWHKQSKLSLLGANLLAKGRVSEDGSTGFLLEVMLTTLRKKTKPGCFALKLEEQRWVYLDGAREPFKKINKSCCVYSQQDICLSIVKTKQFPEFQAHLVKVQAEGFSSVGYDGIPKEKDSSEAYTLGFSPAASSAPPLSVQAGGPYVVASGDLTWTQQQALDRVNEYSKAIEISITESKFSLAQKQVINLKEALVSLQKEGINWSWQRTPTAAGVERYHKLVGATELYRLAYLETQARLGDVQSQLFTLRNEFSSSVMKAMLTSTVNWLNVIPTDPLDGLSGYSDLAGAIALPRTLLSWKDKAEQDSRLLSSQVGAIRHFEALETLLQVRQDEIIAARKAVFERMDRTQAERAVTLNALLLGK